MTDHFTYILLNYYPILYGQELKLKVYLLYVILYGLSQYLISLSNKS